MAGRLRAGRDLGHYSATARQLRGAIGIAFPDETLDFGWTAYTPLDDVFAPDVPGAPPAA